MRAPDLVRVVSASALIALAGCGGPTPSPSVPPGGGGSPIPSAVPPSAAPSLSAAPSPSAIASGDPGPPGSPTEDIGLATFSSSTTVDNPWFPMRPGMHWEWEGDANGDEGRVSRRVVLVVTDLAKTIDGVRTIVAYERDFNEGQLGEAELVFLAQADDGTVWHLGQYPEEYENGEFVDAPTWIAGQRGSKAGIFMHARPQNDTPSYSQGWGPEVGWSDRGRVFETGSRTCVPTGCYDDVLVIQEYSRDEPDAHQLKYYVSGIGNVRVGWAGALEKEQEILQLVEFGMLDAAGLTEARTEALALEKHAYEVSTEVYGTTEPAEVIR